jgi:hypothetical protein
MIWWGGGGGGGGGGGAMPALMPSCVGHVCRPPINLLHYCKVLLDYCIWIVIVVHSLLIIMLLLKLLYLILSLIIFCFIMKNSTPVHPLWPGLGDAHTHTPVNPSMGIPMRWYVILQNLNSQSDVLSRRVYLLINYFSDSVKWTFNSNR